MTDRFSKIKQAKEHIQGHNSFQLKPCIFFLMIYCHQGVKNCLCLSKAIFLTHYHCLVFAHNMFEDLKGNFMPKFQHWRMIFYIYTTVYVINYYQVESDHRASQLPLNCGSLISWQILLASDSECNCILEASL